MEIAGLRFASNRLHFGSRAFWRENMEHLVEADRGWRYTMGEQVPESFIMSQLLGLLLPSAKTTSAGWCSWQIRCRLFEARPFFFLSLFLLVFCRGNVSRSVLVIVLCMHERTFKDAMPIWKPAETLWHGESLFECFIFASPRRFYVFFLELRGGSGKSLKRVC